MGVDDFLPRLAELERAYDGPIPPTQLDAIRHGSFSTLYLLNAAGRRAFYAEAVRSQIRIIRKRRAEGSFYAALLIDLQLYRREFRAAQRCYRAAARARQGET